MRAQPGQAIWLVGLTVVLPSAGVVHGANARAEEPLAVDRLAEVTFRGADLEKSRAFYGNVMGFSEVHPDKDAAGTLKVVHFKVNDDQFVTFHATAPGGGAFRLEQFALQTEDIGRARAWVEARQLGSSPVVKDADGNLRFSLTDPDGIRVEFVEYRAGSWQAELRGRALGAERVSQRLQHAGLVVGSEPAAMAFYRQKPGLSGYKSNNGNWL